MSQTQHKLEASQEIKSQGHHVRELKQLRHSALFQKDNIIKKEHASPSFRLQLFAFTTACQCLNLKISHSTHFHGGSRLPWHNSERSNRGPQGSPLCVFSELLQPARLPFSISMKKLPSNFPSKILYAFMATMVSKMHVWEKTRCPCSTIWEWIRHRGLRFKLHHPAPLG